MIETMSESSTATEIATAISRNSCPTSSCEIKIGINTITVVNADTSTAPQTCCAPRTAAFFEDSPVSRKRKIFSRITIAASTTMPTANANPANETTFMERPNAAIATNAPTIDTGIASDTVSVARNERRNNSITSAANKPPTQIFWRTS